MVANDLLAVKVLKSVHLILLLALEGCSYLNLQCCVSKGLRGRFSVSYGMSTWNVGQIEEMLGWGRGMRSTSRKIEQPADDYPTPPSNDVSASVMYWIMSLTPMGRATGILVLLSNEENEIDLEKTKKIGSEFADFRRSFL